MSVRKKLTRQTWLDAERFAFVPPAKPRISLRVALVYPNNYHLGMSSLGFQLAWRTINEHTECTVERFFLDSIGEGSVDSGASLFDFDLIAFSACYEMDEPNMLGILEAFGIPRLAGKRAEGRRFPLVVLGGVLVSVNRAPLTPYMDGFIHGDAEVALPPMLDALCESGGDSRSARLRSIDGLPGVELTPAARLAAGLGLSDVEARVANFGMGSDDSIRASEDVASFAPPAPPAPRIVDLEDFPGASQILTPNTEFADMALIDLGRGCPHHCTFCWIGHNAPTLRMRSFESIRRDVEALEPLTKRFGLVSSAVGAHPEIDEICRWMMKRGLRVSYSSLRVEEVTPTMLEALVAGGQRTITIAPEAGNARVRRLLGKLITDDQIIEIVERAMSLGIENIKLYTMIGIPSETDEEALDLVRFSERVHRTMLGWARRRGRAGYLGVNLGIFVPKPNIPLNHIEPVALPVVKKRLKKVVREMRKIPNIRLSVSSPDLAAAQSVLSTGSLDAARYLELLLKSDGDWRSANRDWKSEMESHFEARRRISRIAAGRVRSRPREAGRA